MFVGLEDGLEGLLHISELADHKVENPEDVVKVGDEIEVKILRVDTDERKIGLSRKRVEWAEEDAAARRMARRRRNGGAAAAGAQGRRRLRRSGPLFKTGSQQTRSRAGRIRRSRRKPSISTRPTDRQRRDCVGGNSPIASTVRRIARHARTSRPARRFLRYRPNAAHIPCTATILRSSMQRV